MAFGTTPVSTTSLGANQFPVSAVQEPGQTNLTALEGAAGSVDGNGNRTAPASMYVKTGNIVDLATLLTLSGTPTDANTINSFMGRLTKIRDLLNATLTVQGTITEANSAAILAKLVASPALEGGNLATLAGAILASVMQSNTKQINGTTISVNAGNVDAGTQRVAQGGAGTGTKTNVGSSASSVTILASNASRKGAIIYNDSTAILYLDLSGGTATSTSYSVQVGAQGYFEVPGPAIYSGLITGLWAAVNGNARVTEFS